MIRKYLLYKNGLWVPKPDDSFLKLMNCIDNIFSETTIYVYNYPNETSYYTSKNFLLFYYKNTHIVDYTVDSNDLTINLDIIDYIKSYTNISDIEFIKFLIKKYISMKFKIRFNEETIISDMTNLFRKNHTKTIEKFGIKEYEQT